MARRKTPEATAAETTAVEAAKLAQRAALESTIALIRARRDAGAASLEKARAELAAIESYVNAIDLVLARLEAEPEPMLAPV